VAAGALTRDALAGRIKSIRRGSSSDNEPKKTRFAARLSGGRLVTVCAGSLSVDSVITALEDVLARCRAGRNKGHGLRTVLNALADESKQSS